MVRTGGGGGGGAFVVVCTGGGGGAWVACAGAGDGDGDGDGDSVTRISGCSDGDAATSTFAAGGFGDFDGAGPTIAPSAPRPPQHSTSIEAIPTPTTAAICCPLGNRANSSENLTMRSSQTDVTPIVALTDAREYRPRGAAQLSARHAGAARPGDLLRAVPPDRVPAHRPVECGARDDDAGRAHHQGTSKSDDREAAARLDGGVDGGGNTALNHRHQLLAGVLAGRNVHTVVPNEHAGCR